jgi:hypothetical protein
MRFVAGELAVRLGVSADSFSQPNTTVIFREQLAFRQAI